jgi:hypothetical protein
MRVLVEQLWKEGAQIDARERQFASERIKGNLTIEAHEGERFATLLQGEYFEEPREDLLPRLWSPVLIEVKGKKFKLRGVQRAGGRLCHQEWACEVIKQRD